jgi:hypothetical protein
LSEESVDFAERQRAGAHIRQLCFAVTRESQTVGRLTRIIGRYRGFEIIVRASGRRIDSLSTLFSQADLFLRVDGGEQVYPINLGDSDAGIIQSIDAQLRGLEDKMVKSIASQRELEHRQSQINAELARGWELAAKYQELKIRLETKHKTISKSAVAIKDSRQMGFNWS